MNHDRINQLNSFLQTNPKDCFVLHALGLEYKENDPSEARKYFEKVINTDPSYVGTYYHLAEVLIELENYEQAKAIYEMGMANSLKKNDQHTHRELQNAYQNFLFEYDMD